MSFYITPENQKLLWNTITNTTIYINVFGSKENQLLSDTSLKRELLSRNKNTIKDGEMWFRNVIKSIYEANKNIKFSQLQQLNKITISYMINELKIMSQNIYSPNIDNIPINNTTSNIEEFKTQVITPEKKTDISAFEKRQQEYESMFKRPSPPEINFLEKDQIEDKSNVDGRLKKHIEEREAELKKYAPPIFPNAKTQGQNIGQTSIRDTSVPEEVAKETTHSFSNDPLQFLKPISTPSTQLAANLDEIIEIKNMMIEMKKEIKQLNELFTLTMKPVTSAFNEIDKDASTESSSNNSDNKL